MIHSSKSTTLTLYGNKREAWTPMCSWSAMPCSRFRESALYAQWIKDGKPAVTRL